MVSRFCLWVRFSGRHSTGAIRSASCGSTRIASALAKKKRSGRSFASAPQSTMPSAIPVGWLADHHRRPVARDVLEPGRPRRGGAIMSASDCMTSRAGIGSSASPILTVRSYCSTRCSSGRATATPGRGGAARAPAPRSAGRGSRASCPLLSWQLDVWHDKRDALSPVPRATNGRRSRRCRARAPAAPPAARARPASAPAGRRRTSARCRGSPPAAPWSAG